MREQKGRSIGVRGETSGTLQAGHDWGTTRGKYNLEQKNKEGKRAKDAATTGGQQKKRKEEGKETV